MHIATSNKIRAWLQGKKGERITDKPLEISATGKKMEESKEFSWFTKLPTVKMSQVSGGQVVSKHPSDNAERNLWLNTKCII